MEDLIVRFNFNICEDSDDEDDQRNENIYRIHLMNYTMWNIELRRDNKDDYIVLCEVIRRYNIILETMDILKIQHPIDHFDELYFTVKSQIKCTYNMIENMFKKTLL